MSTELETQYDSALAMGLVVNPSCQPTAQSESECKWEGDLEDHIPEHEKMTSTPLNQRFAQKELADHLIKYLIKQYPHYAFIAFNVDRRYCVEVLHEVGGLSEIDLAEMRMCTKFFIGGAAIVVKLWRNNAVIK